MHPLQAAAFDVRFGMSPENRKLIFDIKKLKILHGMPYVSHKSQRISGFHSVVLTLAFSLRVSVIEIITSGGSF